MKACIVFCAATASLTDTIALITCSHLDGDAEPETLAGIFAFVIIIKLRVAEHHVLGISYHLKLAQVPHPFKPGYANW
ncbi:hypothetical protein N9P31_01895 [bacterium]|nr:hypothetical protein [bacterium]